MILRLYSTWPLLIWLSGSNSPTFKTVVHGIIGGVPVPFPTANGNVNPPVPIQQNQKITYTNAIFVEPAYPKVMQSQRLVAPNFTILGFVYMFSWRTNKTSTGVGNFSNYIINEKQAKFFNHSALRVKRHSRVASTGLHSLKIYTYGIFFIQ